MHRSLTLHVPSVDKVFTELSDLCQDALDAQESQEAAGTPSHGPRHRHAKGPGELSEPFEEWFTSLDEVSRPDSPRPA